MISHRHRCIYVKVPKCASTTVLNWFVAHGGGRHSFGPYWHGGMLSERIQTMPRVMNLFPDYATFTFLRNPYARFVSLYLHLRRLTEARSAGVREHPADYGTLREFAELCGEVLGDVGPLWGQEARAFFNVHGRREYGPLGIELRRLGFMFDHARPQTDFLPDCNRERLFGIDRTDVAPLSFIGRVETMAADWRRLVDMLELPAAALPVCNAAVAGAGDARSGRYAVEYDDATRRLVEEIYAADFEFTGCSFGDRRRLATPGPGLGAAGAGIQTGQRPARPRGAGLLAARMRHRAWSYRVSVEARLLRCKPLRRILKPLWRLSRPAR